MSATHDLDRSTSAATPLYVALELGWTSWGLAFSTAPALPPRRVTIPARDLGALGGEIDRARRRFGMPDDSPVPSHYEACRNGFWPHRFLASRGIDNKIDRFAVVGDFREVRADPTGLDLA
jgi:transposase